jgi:methyl-accepting chemotaxis protein
VVLQLRNTLEESRASIAHIATRLHDQNESLNQTQASVGALAERLTALEALAREEA